ncbi:hypothetical protein [Scleromatobacter humisilvae]|uniref:Uncharacterized protein n=1 Tax=Scleromatobacter humisilvae TaxID=2897159 RepID=A0A9X1YN24_9BURK|nr:hypothetical protein [Scleromatobacter humisilvae]MCK9689213.1 hypothetical protein [Scleromatobacter humisilvae]
MRFDKTPELLGIAITVVAVFSTFSVGAISANAANAAPPTPAEQRYQQDRANCLAGKTAESQKTCLKEAGAALQAAREHDLKSPSPSQIAANERKRCEALSGADKTDCLKRAANIDTTTSGSVAGGGDIKETVTVIPGTPGTAPADIHPETMPPTAAGPTTLPPKPSN